MKKISLDLDALSVESFGTTSAQRERNGTVQAASVTVGGYECISQYTNCDCTETPDCSGELTCHFTCVLSCEGTCEGETC
jgi:hypothetical protein